MFTYVSLINWTDQGAKHFHHTITRAEDFSNLVESRGGRVRELLWTVGEYDIVSVTEWPDEQSAVVALLQLGAQGNLRSNTLRAFPAQEMAAIIEQTT